jgi:hypothetical protein
MEYLLEDPQRIRVAFSKGLRHRLGLFEAYV